jgi:uncharacterized membrane protein YqhA
MLLLWHRCFADVYLAGTVMLIFGMGLYGLFISNASSDVPSESDRALRGSSLFGMFALKVITSVMFYKFQFQLKASNHSVMFNWTITHSCLQWGRIACLFISQLLNSEFHTNCYTTGKKNQANNY